MTANDANLQSKIEQFKNLLKGEPDLNVRTDDNFIQRFLACEEDPDKAFKKCVKYYKLKRKSPAWFATEPPSTYQRLLDLKFDYLLEDRDSSGKRIWVFRLNYIDMSKMTNNEVSQGQDLSMEIILDEPETQKNGLIIIVDVKDVSLSMMKWTTPTNALIWLKKADRLPFKKTEYHVVNPSPFFKLAAKVARPLMTAKQKESLFVHEDFNSLHEKVDKSVLPEEYGGLKSTYSDEKLHAIIRQHTEKLAANLAMGFTPKKK